jgi:hypothetical protein
MNFKNYKEWFTSIYGSEATEVILDDKNECITRDEKKLRDFFRDYDRIEPIENGYTIKGCTECISKRIIVRKQDCPGFLGKLNEIKYVIVGLETNIPEKYGFDIHVAFNQFKTEEKEHRLFTRLRLFFPQIKEKAYVTDIAKCRSTNLPQSRKICLETHFLKELKILLELNPEFKIIFQGTTVESYFSNDLKLFSNLERDDEIKSNKNNKFLFKRRYLLFDKKKIPTVTFPHGANRTSDLWKEIGEEEVSAKIKTKLKEFKFD